MWSILWKTFLPLTPVWIGDRQRLIVHVYLVFHWYQRFLSASETYKMDSPQTVVCIPLINYSFWPHEKNGTQSNFLNSCMMAAFSLRLDLAKGVNLHFLENEKRLPIIFFSVVLNWLINFSLKNWYGPILSVEQETIIGNVILASNRDYNHGLRIYGV